MYPVPPPLPTPPPLPPPPDDIRIGPIIRDVLIVFLATFIGGCAVGFWHGATRKGDPQSLALAIGLSNIICGTIAFIIAGVLAPGRRWPHLLLVALGTWVLSLFNVFFMGFSIPQWVSGGLISFVMMGIGGGLSYLFKPRDQPRI